MHKVVRTAVVAVVGALTFVGAVGMAYAADPPTEPIPIIGGITEELPQVEIDDHGWLTGPGGPIFMPPVAPEPPPPPRILPIFPY